jgi:hypothetical protein
VLAESREFFVVRGSTSLDLVVFALALVIVSPALLLALEALVHLARPRAAEAVQFVLVGGLIALVMVQIVKRVADGSAVALVAAAALVGAAAAAAYAQVGAARTVLTFLSPAPFVFAGFFPLGSPVSRLVLGGDEPARAAAAHASGPPIVWVVFDELPIS